MSGVSEWILQFKDPITLAGNSIIIIVALVFMSFMIVKAIASFKGSKMTDGFKFVGMAVIIALIAAIGVGGIQALMETLTKDAGGVFEFNNSNLTPGGIK